MKVWLGIRSNYYRNPSGYNSTDLVALSMAAGVREFDRRHLHHSDLCDYCRASWKHKRGYSEKFVDHDGASVRYVVVPMDVVDERSKGIDI